jgi:chorismate dehydratase
MPENRLRIGAVNYLNTRPLVYGLERFAPGAEVMFDLPSRLADGLAAGAYDVALIPSLEVFRDPTYRVVSNACIACRGPVFSVKLFGRVRPEQIQTLALDEGSRTSAGLAQILLAERFGVRPETVGLPMGAGVGETSADAVLLIGDRAMHPPASAFEFVWDLGDEWVRYTGLPFVFAMWTARASAAVGELASALAAARDEGVAHLAEIAERYAAGLGLTRSECLAYLRDNLYFFLGERELAGLEHFRGLLAKLHLGRERTERESYACKTA